MTNYTPGLFVKYLLASLVTNCGNSVEKSMTIIYRGIIKFADEDFYHQYRMSNTKASLDDFCLYCDEIVNELIQSNKIGNKDMLFESIKNEAGMSSYYFENENTEQAYYECPDKIIMLCNQIVNKSYVLLRGKCMEDFIKYIPYDDEDTSTDILLKSVFTVFYDAYPHKLVLGDKQKEIDLLDSTIQLHTEGFIKSIDVRKETRGILIEVSKLKDDEQINFVYHWMQTLAKLSVCIPSGIMMRTPYEYATKLLELLNENK